MKILLSSRGLFAIGFVILVVSNIVVLIGVASNRSGEPDSQITLTERELQLPYRVHEENSGLALRLAWRTLSKEDDYNDYSNWRTPFWLNAEKLEELGFNMKNYVSSVGNKTFYKQPIPKEVFIVLENDGEPYREAIKRAEVSLEREENSFRLNPNNKRLHDSYKRAEKRLRRERFEETRLFAIDVGLDARELREKYGDRTRFIITRGLVKPRYYYNKSKKEVVGYISGLSVASINVPLKHREIFDSILAQDKSKKNGFRSPRFEVKLAYGNRLEPWIISARSLDDKL